MLGQWGCRHTLACLYTRTRVYGCLCAVRCMQLQGWEMGLLREKGEPQGKVSERRRWLQGYAGIDTLARTARTPPIFCACSRQIKLCAGVRPKGKQTRDGDAKRAQDDDARHCHFGAAHTKPFDTLTRNISNIAISLSKRTYLTTVIRCSPMFGLVALPPHFLMF